MPGYPQLITLTISASVLLSGCTGSRVERQHEFIEYVQEGVPVAETTGGPKYEADLFGYEHLLILQQDPDHPETLLFPGQAAFAWDEKGFFMDSGDRFYVRDRGNKRIAVFDPSGRFERGIGREGQGPGEWSGSFEIYGVTDGIIEVYDPGPRRTTYYSTTGELLEMVQAPITGFVIHYDRDKELYTSLGGGTEVGEDIITKDYGFRTVNADGVTLGSASTQMVPVQYAYPWETRTGVGWSREMPFSPQPFGGYMRDGSVLLVAGAEPIVWWYWLDGSIRKKIVIDLPVRPVTQQDLDSYFRDMENRLEMADNPREKEQIRRMRAHVQFPENRAYWEFLTTDDRGYIWLEVYELDSERSDQGGGVLYHVLSPEGEFLGATRAPAAGRIQRGHLLGIVIDAGTGREDYTVWRLTPRPGGFTYP